MLRLIAMVCMLVLSKGFLAGDIDGRFSTASQSFEKQLTEAARIPDPIALNAIRERRRSEFAEILRDGVNQSEEKLSYGDLAAIAECAEFLGDVKASEKFASLAVSRDATNDRAYYVYTRILLGQGRIKEAEDVIVGAQSKFTPDASFHAIFGILHEARKAEGDPATAALHMHRFISFVLLRMSTDAPLGHAVGHYLRLLKVVEGRSGPTSQWNERTAEYDSTLRDLLSTASKPDRTLPIGHRLAIYDAAFSVSEARESPEAEVVLARWIRTLADGLEQMGPEEGLLEIDHFVRRMERVSVHRGYEAASHPSLTTIADWLNGRTNSPFAQAAARLLARLKKTFPAKAD